MAVAFSHDWMVTESRRARRLFPRFQYLEPAGELCQIDVPLNHGAPLGVNDDIAHATAPAIGPQPTPALLKLAIDADEERAVTNRDHELGHGGEEYRLVACASTRV